ncbi:MAG: hypothetical protein IJA10_10430 [Lachnospiraceae bacterium]|nr:hypothetical protein [Lachnospiraceae bacterium]
MAYWIDPNANNKSNCRSYVCDYRTDIDKLPRFQIEGEKQDNDSVVSQPCLWGSDCMVLEDSSVWILGKNTNEWKEIYEVAKW